MLSGLQLFKSFSFFRKVCRNCRCSVDDHAIQPTAESNGREPINLLLDTIPRQGSQRDLLERLERLNVDDYDTLSHITDPEHDIVLSRIITENMVCYQVIVICKSFHKFVVFYIISVISAVFFQY